MKRGLPALGAFGAVAALALSACSDDDDPNLENVTIPDEVTIPDVSLNVTIPDVSLNVTVPDISLNVTTPDISIPDISAPDFTIPDISVSEDVENAIRDAFPDLSDAQVDCLIDGVSGDNVGADDIMDLAGECDISLQDLIPGG